MQTFVFQKKCIGESEVKMEHIMKWDMITWFKEELTKEERSLATIQKYVHDLNVFLLFLCGKEVFTKKTVIEYKQQLQEKYAVTSVNSMLAALNRFFRMAGWEDCIVKSLKVQREAFRDRELTKEEYYRLLRAAKNRGNRRLYLVMQTICSTGIRVSELPFITAESLRTRRAVVSLKGKTRTVILPAELCRELKLYVKEKDIQRGSIFITRNGIPLDRSNILHDMKALCEEAEVDPGKVFPHNLRHLFAVTYYQAEKDLSHLADLLGHTSVNTTRIYTLVNSREQEKQIDRLGLVI